MEGFEIGLTVLILVALIWFCRVRTKSHREFLEKNRKLREPFLVKVDSPFEGGCSDSKEIADLTQRADLMIKIRSRAEVWNISRSRIAKVSLESESRIDALFDGEIDKFSIDQLKRIDSEVKATVIMEGERLWSSTQ